MVDEIKNPPVTASLTYPGAVGDPQITFERIDGVIAVLPDGNYFEFINGKWVFPQWPKWSVNLAPPVVS